MSSTSIDNRGRSAPTYAIARINDNRFRGLLQEMHEALQSEDDAETIRKVAQSLKMISDLARNRAFRKTGEY